MSKLAALLVVSFAVLQAHGRDIKLVRSDTGVVTGVHNDTVGVTGGVGNYACNYHFEVQTGDVEYAGTDSWVTFELKGKDGYGWHKQVDGSGAFSGMFERGRLDTFNINMVCIHPCHLILHLDGRGIAPDWYCSWIRVTVSGGVSDQQVFHVNQWIGPYTQARADINYCGNHATAVAAAAA